MFGTAKLGTWNLGLVRHIYFILNFMVQGSWFRVSGLVVHIYFLLNVNILNFTVSSSRFHPAMEWWVGVVGQRVKREMEMKYSINIPFFYNSRKLIENLYSIEI